MSMLRIKPDSNPWCLPQNRLSTLFLEAISEQHQMVKCKLKAGVFLSCGVIIRGDVLVSDVRNSIDKLVFFVFLIFFIYKYFVKKSFL